MNWRRCGPAPSGAHWSRGKPEASVDAALACAQSGQRLAAPQRLVAAARWPASSAAATLPGRRATRRALAPSSVTRWRTATPSGIRLSLSVQQVGSQSSRSASFSCPGAAATKIQHPCPVTTHLWTRHHLAAPRAALAGSPENRQWGRGIDVSTALPYRRRCIGPIHRQLCSPTRSAMRRVDYDVEQHQHYARGRAFTAQQVAAWMSAFAAVLPDRRPLVGLDVGSGTGRFTPALARAFGPVTESSRRSGCARWRSAALAPIRRALHWQDSRRGDAVAVRQRRLRTHVPVLAPRPGQARGGSGTRPRTPPVQGGCCCGKLPGHHPEPWWLTTSSAAGGGPRAVPAAARGHRDVHRAGWRVVGFDTVTYPSDGTRADVLERLRLRSLSFFAQLSPDEAEGPAQHRGGRGPRPRAPSPALSEPLLTLERSLRAGYHVGLISVAVLRCPRSAGRCGDGCTRGCGRRTGSVD